MSILMFVNLKGGVAKTTSAVAVAECLASTGHRVLVIDADHQCMSGELLIGESRLLKCENRRITLHDMLAAMLEDAQEKGAFYFNKAECPLSVWIGLDMSFASDTQVRAVICDDVFCSRRGFS